MTNLFSNQMIEICVSKFVYTHTWKHCFLINFLLALLHSYSQIRKKSIDSYNFLLLGIFLILLTQYTNQMHKKLWYVLKNKLFSVCVCV